MKDPLVCIERSAQIARETLVIETVTALNQLDEPVMRYFLGAELNNDKSNYWAPNILCLRRMLSEVGFGRIDVTANPGVPVQDGYYQRHFLHAHRS